MHILPLSGSIRDQSTNTALLQAVRKLLPADTKWTPFAIRELPYFDPQLQFSEDMPAKVKELRALAKAADFIMISTPEYAHGIPGILKNALEWLVCEETMQKKVIVFIATADGKYVKEYLLETLRTMDMQANEEQTFVVPSAKKNISPEGEILDPALKASISKFLRACSL